MFCKSRFLLIIAALGVLLAWQPGRALAQSGGDFSLTWSTCEAAGGNVSSGSGFELSGTLAQPGAGRPMGCGTAFVLAEGYWSVGCESCPADFNMDGSASIADIFAMLTAWFQHAPQTDFNHNGVFDVPDIFAFLSEWFRGCP